MNPSQRFNTTLYFWLMAICFPIALVIFGFSSCSLRKRSEKRACRNGDVQSCLAVGSFYEAKQGGIIAFLMSYADDATVYYFEACKLKSTTGCEHALDIYDHGEQAKNATVQPEDIADTLIAACIGQLDKGCTELEGYMVTRDWVVVRSRNAFQKQCDAGSAQACFRLAGMHMNNLVGLHNTLEEVTPLLDKACAAKIDQSCEMAKAYRDAAANKGSAAPP
jgi:TPR repeat protein